MKALSTNILTNAAFELMADGALAAGTYNSLADCPKGVWVTVGQMQSNSAFGEQDPAVSQRMKELGFLPGARLKIIGYGLFGSDPLAVQINGTKFALRRAEARKISVSPL